MKECGGKYYSLSAFDNKGLKSVTNRAVDTMRVPCIVYHTLKECSEAANANPGGEHIAAFLEQHKECKGRTP